MSAQTAAGLRQRPVPNKAIRENEAEGPGKFERILCEAVVRLCTQEYGNRLEGVILTGSLARGEGTFVPNDEGCRLLGDAEFFLVFGENATPASASELLVLRARIEKELSRLRLECHLSLAAVQPGYLRGLQPSMFAYELRACGRVLWGNPQLLSMIPAFSPGEIPREDAWRTLCNRMIEMLEAVADLETPAKKLGPALFYRTVKLCLDMAASFLLFAGKYKPSYRERAQSLRALAEDSAGPEALPFDLRKFSGRVSACTEWKLSGTGSEKFLQALGGDEAALVFWEEAVGYARLLWHWEMQQLTRVQGQASPRELLQKWMSLQPPSACLRGWLYVLRKQGWHRSWRHWPQWVARAWKGSPRYWIYAVATELFFRLPCLVLRPGQTEEIEAARRKLGSWLPVTIEAKTGAELVLWRQRVLEVVMNYNRFLVETRS
jgi:hypothetical protein